MTTTAPISIRDLADPKLMNSVEDLDFIARCVVEGVANGLHRSPYVGFSVDFASHREYSSGDDLRHLNWKLYGRHDRLYIKQYDAETNVDLHIVLDVSRSMTVGDDGLTKLRYASLLSASLARLASRQRDAVGLTLFADRVLEHYSARGHSDHLFQLMSALARQRPHPSAESPRVLHEVAELMPRRGLVVLISDLYYESVELFAALDHFIHFGHDVLLFQVLSPLERHMPIDGAVKLVDVETGTVLETLTHEIRDRFTLAVEKWIDEIHTGSQARDVEHVCITTDLPLELALANYFVKRALLF
jgi:uncharacterized protein (DUF58 family)